MTSSLLLIYITTSAWVLATTVIVHVEAIKNTCPGKWRKLLLSVIAVGIAPLVAITKTVTICVKHLIGTKHDQ